MRNLFALIGFAVVAFAVVGWYCGWYQLTLNKGAGGKVEIKTEVDTKKVADDSSTFFQKLGQILSERAQSATTGNAEGKTQPGTTGSVPPATASGPTSVPRSSSAPLPVSIPPVPPSSKAP